MSPRVLHVLTGVVWGLVLGALTAVFTVAAAAGFSWIYLFGDEPWPEATSWVLPGLGIGVFLAVLLGGVILGLRTGQRTAAAAPEEAARRMAATLRLLIAGVVLALVLAGAAAARFAGQEDARETGAHQAAFFDTLQAERQNLVAVTLSRAPRPMSYDLAVHTRGARGGLYRFTWSLRSSGYEESFAEDSGELALEPGDNRVNLPVDAWSIVERYHDLAFGGRDVDVEVAEHFRMEVTLTPVLDPAARAQLPPHVAHNLTLGQSALIDRAVTDLDMQFRIGGPEYELLE